MTDKVYPESRSVSAKVTMDLFYEMEEIRDILKIETRQEYIVRALRIYNAMHNGVLKLKEDKI